MNYEEYTKEELLERVHELEDILEDEEETLNEKITLARDLTDRLIKATDFLADKGYIVNTPHGKYRFVNEGIGLD